MKMKDGASINDQNKTILDELQHALTLDSREHYKHIIIKWLLSKNHCIHNRNDHLNFFLFEITSEWCFDNSKIQGIQAFQTLSIALWLKYEKSFLRVDLKKFSSSGCLDKNISSTRNQITKSLCNLSRFHSHGVKLWLEKCTDVIRSNYICSIDISNICNIDSLENVTQSIAYSIESLWNNPSKSINITKCSKNWWNTNCNRDIEKYKESKQIENWKLFKNS